MKVGQIIRKQRKLRKISLEELEKQSGVSRSTISRIERLELSPTWETVERIAGVLGLIAILENERKEDEEMEEEYLSIGNPDPIIIIIAEQLERIADALEKQNAGNKVVLLDAKEIGHLVTTPTTLLPISEN